MKIFSKKLSWVYKMVGSFTVIAFTLFPVSPFIFASGNGGGNNVDLAITCDTVSVSGNTWTLEGTWHAYNGEGLSSQYDVAVFSPSGTIADSSAKDLPGLFTVALGPNDYVAGPPNNKDDMEGTWSNEITLNSTPTSISAALYHAGVPGNEKSGDAECNFVLPPANNSPVANNDSYSVDQDTALAVDVANGILGNDSDADSDPLTAIINTNVTSGTLVLNADGSFTYTPNAGFVGSDSFTYKADDGTNDSNVATVTITVSSVNIPNTLPTITLNGANPLELVVNVDTYTELGATADDAEDGNNLPVTDIDASAVNTTQIGTYNVTYDFTDSDGGVASTVTRTVRVVAASNECNDGVDNDGDGLVDYPTDTGCTSVTDPSENQPPTITLTGANPQTITLNSTYTELGATADDAEDGNNLTVTNIDASVVNPATAGSYQVTYDFTDSDGAAAAQVIRTVEVKTACSDGIDNDNDTLIDTQDPGCTDATDNDETDPIVNPTTQCSDNIDNDGDGKIDLQDPGCVDANDNDETDPVTPPQTTDVCPNITGAQATIPSGYKLNSSGDCVKKSSSTSIGGYIGSKPSVGEVLGASTSCGIYVDKYLKKGLKGNDKGAVTKVQQFLNDYTHTSLTLDGIFGNKTEAALKAFQLSHKDKILDPWKLILPTGIFYLTTQTEVNNVMCPDLALPVPTNLIPFSAHPNTPKV